MNIIILEDEEFYADELYEILKRWEERNPALNIMHFRTGEELLTQYRENGLSADIIFIDIKLPGINGLETAETLRKLGYKNNIVFTTNYDEFSRQGYDVEAAHYLLKPLEYEQVAKCLERIERNVFFTYTHKGETLPIPYDNIVYFESSRHYIKMCTTNLLFSPDPFRSNLSDLATQKLPKRFVQCHRAFIVNLSHIIRIKDQRIDLSNGEDIPIGKMYLENLLKQIANFTY